MIATANPPSALPEAVARLLEDGARKLHEERQRLDAIANEKAALEEARALRHFQSLRKAVLEVVPVPLALFANLDAPPEGFTGPSDGDDFLAPNSENFTLEIRLPGCAPVTAWWRICYNHQKKQKVWTHCRSRVSAHPLAGDEMGEGFWVIANVCGHSDLAVALALAREVGQRWEQEKKANSGDNFEPRVNGAPLPGREAPADPDRALCSALDRWMRERPLRDRFELEEE